MNSLKEIRNKYILISKIFLKFHIKNPLFFIAIILLISTYLYFENLFVLSFFICTFSFLCIFKKVFYFPLILISFVSFLYYTNNFPKNTIEGKGKFLILSEKKYRTKTYLRGKFKNFKSNGTKYKNINAFTIFPKKIKFKENALYVSGKLEKISRSYYKFTLSKIHGEKRQISLPKIREVFYKKIKRNIFKTSYSFPAKNFFYAIVTSKVENNFLRFFFAKCGLQHIMAISGFHFGLVFLFFSIIFSKIFSKKINNILLLLLLNIYFLFLGPSPSILRAFIMIQTAIFAKIFYRENFAINALSLSLIIQLILFPVNIFNLGFQLSYLCSFALITLFEPIDKYLSKFFLARNTLEIMNLYFISKIFHYISTFIRNVLAISIAVNIFAMPIVLFYFHKFPIFSFIYNLFFPLLITFSIVFFIISIIFQFTIPFVSSFINYINNVYTTTLLNTVYYSPSLLEYYVRTKSITFSVLIIYMFLAIVFSIYFKERNLEKKDFKIFAYI